MLTESPIKTFQTVLELQFPHTFMVKFSEERNLLGTNIEQGRQDLASASYLKSWAIFHKEQGESVCQITVLHGAMLSAPGGKDKFWSTSLVEWKI